MAGYAAGGAARSLKGIPPIRPEADFYVHLNIARYVFSRSKYFEHPGKRLALAGGRASPPKSGSLSNLRCLCPEAAAYAVKPLKPK